MPKDWNDPSWWDDVPHDSELLPENRREINQVTADAFNSWLAEMKSAGLARSDAECARLLGISANSVVALKKNGADLRTALACRALLHRLEPYA